MTDSTARIKKYSIVGLIFAVLFSIASYALSVWTNIHTAEVLFYVSLNTTFFAALLFNEHRLIYKAELESLEQEEVRKSAGASKELFDESDEAMMLASRALKTWRSLLLPAISLIYGAGAIVFLVLKWQEWSGHEKMQIENQMAAAACAGALGVCYFLVGAFFGGASRQVGGIKLRPFSAWAYFSSIVCAALVVVLFLGEKQYPDIDHYSHRILTTFLILMAFEVSVNFLVDWYRPRFHKDEKSILESRFLAIFTDSGSIASNIAHALDYQFGLKISEAGFYRFLLKTLIPLAVVQLLTLYLLSCFTLIEIGERGLRETLGKIDDKKELGPGLYVKLPWPMAKIHVFEADRIQNLEIGQQPKADTGPEEPPEDEDAKVVVTEDVSLWSKSGHHKEGMEDINFLISTKPVDKDGKFLGDVAPVNMITVLIPVEYRIKAHVEGEQSPLYKYLFNYADAQVTLKKLISEVVMQYLSSTDYFDFLGKDSQQASEDLQNLVQKKADLYGLGVEIVSLALETSHPPESISKYYDDVVAAIYEKDVTVFEAQKSKKILLSDALIKERALLSEAKSSTGLIEYVDASGKKQQLPMKLAMAKEKAIRLKSQQSSYQAQPYLFTLINYLAVIEKGLVDTRKIIIDSTKADYNFRFDLKPKLVPDLENLEIPE